MSCANAQCKWHRPGGGCRLFVGQAWQTCRKATHATPKSKKTQKGPQP